MRGGAFRFTPAICRTRLLSFLAGTRSRMVSFPVASTSIWTIFRPAAPAASSSLCLGSNGDYFRTAARKDFGFATHLSLWCGSGARFVSQCTPPSSLLQQLVSADGATIESVVRASYLSALSSICTRRSRLHPLGKLVVVVLSKSPLLPLPRPRAASSQSNYKLHSAAREPPKMK